MCGIIGYVGKKEAVPVLLNGLFRLEYRGYDSAGLAVLSKNTTIPISTAHNNTFLIMSTFNLLLFL